MNSVTSSWRQRRRMARTQRALNKALARSTSPTMREEILTIANNAHFYNLPR